MWRSAWAKKTKYSVAHPQPAVQSQERVAKLCHPFSFWAHTSTPCRQERERERDVSSSSWCSTPPSSSPRGGGRPGAVLVGEACRLDGESDREGEATAKVDQWKGTATVEVDMAPGARSAARPSSTRKSRSASTAAEELNVTAAPHSVLVRRRCPTPDPVRSRSRLRSRSIRGAGGGGGGGGDDANGVRQFIVPGPSICSSHRCKHGGDGTGNGQRKITTTGGNHGSSGVTKPKGEPWGWPK